MRRRIAIAISIVMTIFFSAVWIAGGILASPHRQPAGKIPSDLNGQEIKFSSGSGFTLNGWWAPKPNGKGTVILLHGVRANRLSMLDRARFLSKAGYGTLLFDLQSHGESTGQQITFGYLESRDAAAAVDFLRGKKSIRKDSNHRCFTGRSGDPSRYTAFRCKCHGPGVSLSDHRRSYREPARNEAGSMGKGHDPIADVAAQTEIGYRAGKTTSDRAGESDQNAEADNFWNGRSTHTF